MAELEAKLAELEKLVENTSGVTLEITDMPTAPRNMTKKQLRRIAGPRIRAHKVKGRQYYYYVRGTDKEIYLGSADSILRQIMAIR